MDKKLITYAEFDLSRDMPSKAVKGVVSFYEDRIEINESGIIKTLPMDTVTSFSSENGVGAVSLTAETKGGSIVICRADMSYSEWFSTAVLRLNRWLKNGIIGEDFSEYRKPVCEKCGRPIPPGSDFCPHCVKKGGYIKRLLAIAKPFRKYIIITVFLYFLIAGVNILVPYLNKILVDDYIKAETMPKIAQYITVVLLILLANIVMRGLSILRSYIQIYSGTKVITLLRSMTFSKIEELSISRISKRTTGELMTRVTQDTNTIQSFITMELGTAAEQLLTLIAIGTVLFVYDWRLALMILLPAPLVILSHRLMWRFLSARYGRQWYVGAKANTILHDIFSGVRVVKSFGMEKEEAERYDETIEDEKVTCQRNETYFALINPITVFLMGIGEFFLLYYVGNHVLGGTMKIGEMQQFSAYASMIYSPLRWLARLPRSLSRTMTSVAKVFDVIDEKSDVSDRQDAKDADIGGVIEIENLSFGYETTPGVLKDINLTVKPGEMIGLVGRSGVGKSTLINLIMRMYDPDEGSIKIGGTDIRDITQQSLRSQMGVVLQETLLFSGTLYQNIAFSKPGATYEEVINAAKVAGVHKYAVTLPDGYNTVIGEKGYTLSGGERQRVAIARALLHDPKILILDEATSSLDTETEKELQDVLAKLIAGRTTIAIAHRLSTLRNATKLVVLDHGSVAEVGTHEELMRKKGQYFELVMAQRRMVSSKKRKNALPYPADASDGSVGA